MTLAAPPQRIATPDLVTKSFFPALAAEEPGIHREEGIAMLDLVLAGRALEGAPGEGWPDMGSPDRATN